MGSIDEIIDGIIKRESGFVDHPSDRGGPTKYGITQKTLSGWLGHPATVAEVAALTVAEAHEILRREYVEKPGFDRVKDAVLRELLVDCAVNHGPERAVKWLQRALGVVRDGVFGPKTAAALEAAYSWAVYYSVLATRIRFYGAIISDDHTQAEFAAGWMNRAAEFVEHSGS